MLVDIVLVTQPPNVGKCKMGRISPPPSGWSRVPCQGILAFLTTTPRIQNPPSTECMLERILAPAG